MLPGVVGVAIEEEDPGVEGLMAGEPTGDAIVTAVPGEDSADGPGDAVAPAAGGEGDAVPMPEAEKAEGVPGDWGDPDTAPGVARTPEGGAVVIPVAVPGVPVPEPGVPAAEPGVPASEPTGLPPGEELPLAVPAVGGVPEGVAPLLEALVPLLEGVAPLLEGVVALLEGVVPLPAGAFGGVLLAGEGLPPLLPEPDAGEPLLGAEVARDELGDAKYLAAAADAAAAAELAASVGEPVPAIRRSISGKVR